jgi:UDP-N-acetylmuramate dehydrogenase
MKFQRDEALRQYNTLALQARADALVSVASDAELLNALAWARARSMHVVPLGEGSNIVLAGDIRALVVRQQTRGIQIIADDPSGIRLHVAAGENWHELVRWTVYKGFFGLENLALIPGTVGAAPIQNIGAYGVELKSVLRQVFARQIADDIPVAVDNASCSFGYRDSVFKHKLQDQLVITGIEIQLSKEPHVNISYPALAGFFTERPHLKPTPETVFEAVVRIRKSKLPDPSVEPNAGSFFKNPCIGREQAVQLVEKYPALPCYPQVDDTVKVSAAWLIDYCGWKGFRQDNLGVHREHALVLVNYGCDSGKQLLALAGEIAASVFNSFGIRLETEPRLYGADT